MSFGERVRSLYEERELTQVQLAKELHIAKSTLNGYVTDSRQPDGETVVRIANYFDVSTDYLLGVTNVRKGVESVLNVHEGNLVGIYRDLRPENQDLLIEQARFYHKIDRKQKAGKKKNSP